MAFELFTSDKVVPRGEPMLTITAVGRISLNKNASSRFEKEKISFVQLLWDKDGSKIAIRPSEKTAGAYKLSFGANGNGAGFSCLSFLNYIQYDWTATRNFPADWDGDQSMYVVTIPAENIGKPVPNGHTKRFAAAKGNRQQANEKETTEAVS